MLTAQIRADKLMSAINLLHDACVGGDESLIKSTYNSYEQVLYEVHEGSSSILGKNSLAMEALESCAASPGTVPLWGQIGEFALIVDGVETLVKYHPQYHRWNAMHFAFYALDQFKPYISETGFKSLFINRIRFDGDVRTFAERAFKDQMQIKLPKPKKAYTPAWYVRPATLQESSGQGAFNF